MNNTLLILIVLLLTVVVVWMIAMTVLYHSVCKSFEALKDLVVNVVGDQNKTINEINRGLESFLELFKGIEEQALDCYELQKELSEAVKQNQEFSLKVIQEARRLLNTSKSILRSQEVMREGLRIEDPEDNPEPVNQ